MRAGNIVENYQIITDEVELDRFIEWLPDLGPSECYYFQLFGRKKYAEEGLLQSGQQSLNRFVCTKDRIKYKILQLEIPLGRYVNRDVVIPQECLVLYMNPNPRCHEKAAKNLLKILADKITKKYEHYNTHQLALTELHRAKSRNFVVDFDFDEIDYEDISNLINKVINIDAYKVVKTRGGFHLLVMLDKIHHDYKKSWHNGLCKIGADVVGDCMIPVPGTMQGGHLVHFIN
jgi:hypothetical protein